MPPRMAAELNAILPVIYTENGLEIVQGDKGM
jgi:hypothetical protein